MKLFSKLTALIALSLFIGMAGNAAAQPWTTEVGYGPMSMSTWSSTYPTRIYYLSDNVPYAFIGKLYGGVNTVIYNTTTTARTVTAAETNSRFIMTNTSDDPVTFNLPAAVAGLRYTFADCDATAAADLIIQAAGDDTIDNSAAGGTLTGTTDSYGQTVTIYAIDSTTWIIESIRGTWTASS